MPKTEYSKLLDRAREARNALTKLAETSALDSSQADTAEHMTKLAETLLDIANLYYSADSAWVDNRNERVARIKHTLDNLVMDLYYGSRIGYIHYSANKG